MANGDKFYRGDFLRKDNKKGSFMIYEGNNLSESAYKRMTLICFYDPEKFEMGPVGYENRPSLELATMQKPCPTTIDTEEEDYWVKKCNEKEKEAAIEVLKKYGLVWCEETLSLVEINTGEIVRKIIIPDNTYYGQIIRPKGKRFIEMIKRWCISKIKPSYEYSNYGYYDD